MRRVVAAIILLLAACANGPRGPTRFGAVRFDNVPDGIGRLRPDAATGFVNLEVDAFGFRPSSRHTVAIAPGTCLDTDQQASVSFEVLEADTAGRATARIRAIDPTPGGIPAPSRLHIRDPAGGANPIVCTDLPAEPTASFRLYPFPSEKPFGHADVAHRGERLTLILSLNAMPRRRRHRVEIGDGSCRSQRGVRRTLDDIATDPDGAVRVTLRSKTDPPEATGWFLVVRAGTSEDDRPILCGDFGTLREGPATSTSTRP